MQIKHTPTNAVTSSKNNNSTKLSKHTDDTFSDLVLKNIKDNKSSNKQSSVASKQTSRAAAAKVSESKQIDASKADPK